MKSLQPKIGTIVCACLLIGAAAPASAFDSAVYSGAWTNQTPALTVKIDANRAEITVDGKTHADATLQYMPSQLPTAPFLYLDARDDSGKQDHQFYLMVSTDEQNQPRLNGYYDRVVLNAAREKVATESFPLSLQQLQQNASAR